MTVDFPPPTRADAYHSQAREAWYEFDGIHVLSSHSVKGWSCLVNNPVERHKTASRSIEIGERVAEAQGMALKKRH
jgi:hypothetical protein